MDDLSDLLGIKHNPEEALALNELARRANDTYRVYNPTAQDYHVAWDLSGSGGYFVVPAREKDLGFGKGQNVHPRYIAFKFFKEISAIMLAAEQKLAVDEENERRRKSGNAEMDKTFQNAEELKFITQHNLMLDNQTKLLELLPKIILGKERDWGMDQLPYRQREDQVKWENVIALIDRTPGSAPDAAKPLENKPTTTKNPEDDVDPLAAVL